MLRRAARLVIGRAAAAIDRVATLAAHAQTARRRQRNRAESLGHEERVRLLGLLAERYAEVAPDAYFRAARPIAPTPTPVRALPHGGRVVDLRWPSGYEPFLPEMQRRYVDDKPDNRTAAARLFLHAEPRPLILLVHGYMSGQHHVEERMWPVAWLFRLGLDAALYVLPFHGLRAIAGRRAPPPFPGSDPRFTNEGFRQALGELSDLGAWARGRGHRAVGVMGMSLGGYTTALAATVLPELAFAVPVIPLGSLADFAREQGRLGRSEAEAVREHAALEAAQRIVSPLARRPLLEPRRVLVVGAEADRITPLEHAQKLAAHFGAPLETWPGGHLFQYGRADAFRRVGALLDGLELTARRPRGRR